MTTSRKLGVRVLAPPPRLDEALLAQFRGAASANVADAMGRFNFMDPGIQSRSKLRRHRCRWCDSRRGRNQRAWFPAAAVDA